MKYKTTAFDCDVRVYKWVDSEVGMEKEFDYNAKLIKFTTSGHFNTPIAIIKQIDGFVAYIEADLIQYM